MRRQYQLNHFIYLWIAISLKVKFKKYVLWIPIGSSFHLMKGFRCYCYLNWFSVAMVSWMIVNKISAFGKIKFPRNHIPCIYCIVWLELCNIFLLGELLGVIVAFCPWFSHCLPINGCTDHTICEWLQRDSC